MCPPLPGFRQCWRRNPMQYNLAHLKPTHQTHYPSWSSTWSLSHLPTCISSWTEPSTHRRTGSKLGGGGGCVRHQRRTRNRVRGVAELAALRAHTTKESKRYTRDMTTGILFRGNRSGPPNAPRRRTTPKPQVENTTPGTACVGPVTLGPD